MLMYGLIDTQQLVTIATEVAICIGSNKSNIIRMLIETANVETGGGTIRDTSKGAGMGLTQFDYIGFQDTLDRTRTKDKNKILEYFNINIDWVEWTHLRYNPLLAIIFTRLKYKLIPEAIPTNMKDRASYWKRYYNTKAGKGTIKHYIEMNIK